MSTDRNIIVPTHEAINMKKLFTPQKKKNTFYTKGQSMVPSLLITLIIAALVLLFYIFFLRNRTADVDKVMGKYTCSLTNDYDQDGIADFTDKSPCVDGETTISGADGKQWYYFDETKKDDSGKEVAEPCKLGEYTPKNIERMVDADRDAAVCVLPPRVCAELLEKEYKTYCD